MFFGLFGKKKAKHGEAQSKKAAPAVREELLGDVTHYFPHAKACVINLKSSLNVGEKVHIKGHTTDFTQEVASMQIDGKPITSANKGDEIGILVKDKVRATDTVYRPAK